MCKLVVMVVGTISCNFQPHCTQVVTGELQRGWTVSVRVHLLVIARAPEAVAENFCLRAFRVANHGLLQVRHALCACTHLLRRVASSCDGAYLSSFCYSHLLKTAACNDTVKKPKLDQHSQRCKASFTCLDCSTTFNTPSECVFVQYEG